MSELIGVAFVLAVLVGGLLALAPRVSESHGLELTREVGRIVVREDRAAVAGDVGDPHRG